MRSWSGPEKRTGGTEAAACAPASDGLAEAASCSSLFGGPEKFRVGREG